jgi:ATP-dependent HslUV protease ATP-binding subunit HslU
MQNTKVRVKHIVNYLNEHVISQEDAKKQLAILIKNKARYENIKEEDWKKNITPFNALIIGPTGSGKTELFRKLAEYLNVAFTKVDISGYTRSGYVGKDVEDIVSVHLYEAAKRKAIEELREELREDIENKIIKELAAAYVEKHKDKFVDDSSIPNTIVGSMLLSGDVEDIENIMNSVKEIEKKIKLKDPDILKEEVTVIRQVYNLPKNAIIPPQMKDQFKEEKAFTDTIENLLKELFEIDIQEMVKDSSKLRNKIKELMENGIIFIDEIDKIAGKDNARIDTSGVQKELLTLVEGTTVQTEIGPISTDHILFIAAGAFHTAKPSDLLPELLGRFPIRIVLRKLTKEDLRRILVEPKYAILKKVQKLYETDNIKIEFTEDAIDKIAEIAYQLNNEDDDLGARRLHTIVNMLTEDIDFEIEDKLEKGEISDDEEYVFVIDKDYVENKFNEKNEKIKKALEYIDDKKKKVGFVF